MLYFDQNIALSRPWNFPFLARHFCVFTRILMTWQNYFLAANKKKNQYTSRNKKFAKILVEQKWKRMNLKIIFTILQICMIFWKMWIQSEREFWKEKTDLSVLPWNLRWNG